METEKTIDKVLANADQLLHSMVSDIDEVADKENLKIKEITDSLLRVHSLIHNFYEPLTP